MQRFILSLLTGLWGSAVLAAMGVNGPPDLQLCTLGASMAADLVLAPLMARPGPICPPLAVLLSTLSGAALAGLAYSLSDMGMRDPWGGLVLGPLLVVSAVLSSPAAALAWVTGAFALPMAARAMRG